MKRIFWVIMVLFTATVFAAGKSDKELLKGTWEFKEAVSSTGQVKTNTPMKGGMRYTFDGEKAVVPITNIGLAYTVSEKDKTITIKNGTTNLSIGYKFAGENTLQYTSVVATWGTNKQVIVGKGGLMRIIILIRKK